MLISSSISNCDAFLSFKAQLPLFTQGQNTASPPFTLLISLSTIQPSTFPVFPEPFAESVGTLRAAREAALPCLPSAINQGVSPDREEGEEHPGSPCSFTTLCTGVLVALRHPPFLPPSLRPGSLEDLAGEQRGKSPAAAGCRHRPSSQPRTLPLLPGDSSSQSEAVANGPTDVLCFAC